LSISFQFAQNPNVNSVNSIVFSTKSLQNIYTMSVQREFDVWLCNYISHFNFRNCFPCFSNEIFFCLIAKWVSWHVTLYFSLPLTKHLWYQPNCVLKGESRVSNASGNFAQHHGMSRMTLGWRLDPFPQCTTIMRHHGDIPQREDEGSKIRTRVDALRETTLFSQTLTKNDQHNIKL